LKDYVVASTKAELWTKLLAQLESGPRSRILAEAVSALLPDAAVLIFAITESEPEFWTLKAALGDVSVSERILPLDSGTLGAVAREKGILQFTANELDREDFAHIDLRQNFNTITCLPFLLDEQLLGCIEVVSFSTPPADEVLDAIAQIANCAAVALSSAAAYESERNASLSSVLRLTRLYDIEKVFNATLEMQPLFEIICSKVCDLTGASAVGLWMVDQADMLLVQQSGKGGGSSIGDRLTVGGGVVWEVGESGEDMLVQEEDESLRIRNERSPDGAIVSLMAAALLNGESLVGVLEVIRIEPQEPFSEDDLFTLTQVAASAAQALHNSSLLQAERKIQVLQTLVSIAQEISSTLNLPRVLEAIVSQPQLVIPYERAAIALERRSRLTVQAVSGIVKLDPSSPDIQLLNEVLSWASGLGTEIHVTQHDEEISDPRPETREKFRRYFQSTGSRSFYAIPLIDEEGALGILSFESPDADFLTELHFEIIKVLASQATLALRNASLYKEVPFIGILEPLIDKKRRFMAIERRRRALILTLAAVVLLALVLLPFPMRVGGQAEVAPAQTQYVRAEEDGVVQQVFVHEGDKVAPGTPLLQMVDWSERSALAEIEARYNASTAQVSRALIDNDASGAGQRQLEANYLREELLRSEQQLTRMTLRSVIAGTIATPHVESLAGRKLSTGDPLLQVTDTADVLVDVSISEHDIELIKVGAPATIKLESFPASTFRGTVRVISPTSETLGEERLFFARITVSNANSELRPGMSGWSKVNAGAHPLGYVLFRNVGLWAWAKLWNWFSW